MDVVLFTCVSGIFFQRAIGAYQIAHYLRSHGYTVQVIDFTDHFTSKELIDTAEKFISSSTIAIGLSSTFYSLKVGKRFLNNDRNKFDDLEFPENIVEAITHIKGKNPKIKIMVGGTKSVNANSLPFVDQVFHGYTEDQVLTYLNFIRRKPHKPTQFNIEHLDHRFVKNDCILPNETVPIELSRGCIFKCKFCAFPLNGKSKFDYLRDLEQIRDELLYNHEHYGTTNYFLSDDTFNDSTYKVERLHKIFTQLPFKIRFTTYLRLDLLHSHQEQIDMLREMGLASPFFGIESLNQKSASCIGKGMKVNKVKDFLLELYYDRWKEQIPITGSFIIGLPYETKETIMETYNWVRSNPINPMFFPLGINNKFYYKSEFGTNYKDYGYTLDEDTGYWENEHFTYDEANSLAEKFNDELGRAESYPASWFLMTLINHGYTIDQAKITKIKDLNWRRIIKQRDRNIKHYKQLLKEIQWQKK